MGRWHDRAFGDYEEQYGILVYEDAVVLDIGADYGTTARFFLHHGARHVYVSEKLPAWVERLRAFCEGEPRATLLPPLSVGDPDAHLLGIRPDVVKVDCEGCEALFLDARDDALQVPRAWVLEVHSRELHERFHERLTSLGYRVRVVADHPNNPPDKYRAVIAAERLP